MVRKNISSGSQYEKPIGFSRAVRIKNFISVSGTAPIASDGSTVCPNDLYGQAKHCLEIIKKAIEEAGGNLRDVIRTRIMLIEISNWQEAAQAHGEFFSEIKPATSFIGVSSFIDPNWLIEIEADCVIDND
ncbi:MAG: RidA family protein [Promethearchaeota archaeon]|nr:MAG: RidA family protein [Candidatus Lokiarchaeota archaeon]